MNAKYIACAGYMLFAMGAMAAEFEVVQKNNAFNMGRLQIKVGDTVKFTNQDPVIHNLLSLSDVKPFDLTSSFPGQSKTVTFDRPGTWEVECGFHPHMRMTVEVTR